MCDQLLAVLPCSRLGKLFNGCNFKGRYDTIPDGPVVAWNYGDYVGHRQIYKTVYRGDVCTTCGKTVNV